MLLVCPYDKPNHILRVYDIQTFQVRLLMTGEVSGRASRDVTSIKTARVLFASSAARRAPRHVCGVWVQMTSTALFALICSPSELEFFALFAPKPAYP